MKFYVIILCGACLLFSCTNPFAPALDDEGSGSNFYGDQTTVEGVFKNLQSSYLFGDTLLYGSLLADEFTFVYKDYENGGVDVSWGRAEEMLATAGLFRNTQNLDLTWNGVEIQDGDSLALNVSRGFNLEVVYNPAEIDRVYGRIKLRLERDQTSAPWMVVRWEDLSEF